MITQDKKGDILVLPDWGKSEKMEIKLSLAQRVLGKIRLNFVYKKDFAGEDE